VTLARLDDFENACAAYERAAEIDGGADFTIRLNYAITCHNGGDVERSREQFAAFETAWLAADEESRAADPDVETQAETLRRALGL
jgi:Bardet-Biedl syndrome 4 protein